MEEYFKVTNAKENHHGFQYRNGLNVLIEEFNDNPNDSCCAGGLYFTYKENIHKFFDYGIYLRVVTLPKEDPEFKMVRDPQGDKWRANKIILGEKYSLFDHKTYQLFGLGYMQRDMMDGASSLGFIDTLEWLVQSGLNTHYSANAIDSASQSGRINVLNWWLKSGLKLKYSSNAINFINNNKRMDEYFDILDWWKKSGLEISYSRDILDNASERGYVDILEQWKKSGLPMKYSSRAIIFASINGRIGVLDWWLKSGLKLIYSNDAMDGATKKNRVDVLRWWHDSGLELRYSKTKYLEFEVNPNTQNWWKQSGLKIS